MIVRRDFKLANYDLTVSRHGDRPPHTKIHKKEVTLLVDFVNPEENSSQDV